MEAAASGARQSSSATNPDRRQTTSHPYQPQPYRDAPERSQHDHPAMATATLLHPSSTYPPPASYSSGYPQPGPNMAAAAEPRKSIEDSDGSKRQSLPSISEVISKYPAPTSSSMQPSMQPSTSFPSPFTGPLRSYADSEKGSSPQALRPASSYPARQEPLSSFVDSPRTSYNGRSGLSSVSDTWPSPSIKSELPPHHYPHDSHKDPRSLNGGYPHPPAPSAPAPGASSYPTAPLPHGQMPLPPYPPSPRHSHPHGYGSYDQRTQSGHMEDGERGVRPAYEHPGYGASWNYGEALGRLAGNSRTVFNFAEAYGRIAQEQHGAHPIPERLPTQQEVNDMIANADMVKAALERVKDLVQESIRSERAREPKIKTYEEEQEAPMFEDGMKPQYNMAEVKKRRGRAAPPGRCHSCNRVDTPEWRRGPDGARTLCNACGLHYAKLERKRQLEQRNIRPKPEERS